MAGAINGAASALVAQLAAARRRTVDLADSVKVVIDTPSQFAAQALVQAMLSGEGDKAVALLVPLAQDWSGVTQAMLLGAGVGSEDPAPFAGGLLQAWLADRPADVLTLAEKAVEAARTARERAAGAEKN